MIITQGKNDFPKKGAPLKKYGVFSLSYLAHLIWYTAHELWIFICTANRDTCTAHSAMYMAHWTQFTVIQLHVQYSYYNTQLICQAKEQFACKRNVCTSVYNKLITESRNGQTLVGTLPGLMLSRCISIHLTTVEATFRITYIMLITKTQPSNPCKYIIFLIFRTQQIIFDNEECICTSIFTVMNRYVGMVTSHVSFTMYRITGNFCDKNILRINT